MHRKRKSIDGTSNGIRTCRESGRWCEPLMERFMKTTPELCAKEASPCSCVTGYKSKILRWNRVEAPLDMSNDISRVFFISIQKEGEL
mgnify:CR=1 FL=1